MAEALLLTDAVSTEFTCTGLYYVFLENYENNLDNHILYLEI